MEPALKYKAVLFELEGVLVRTLPTYYHTIIGRVFQDFGVKVPLAEINRFWKERGKNNLLRDEFGLEPEEFWERYRSYDPPDCWGKLIRPYGDTSIIEDLRKNGVEIGVLSSVPVRRENLEKLFGIKNFQIVADTVSNGSESLAQRIVYCLQTMGITDARRAIYVGKDKEEVDAVRKTKVPVTLLDRWGEYFPDRRLRYVHDLTEFRGIVGLSTPKNQPTSHRSRAATKTEPKKI